MFTKVTKDRFCAARASAALRLHYQHLAYLRRWCFPLPPIDYRMRSLVLDSSDTCNYLESCPETNSKQYRPTVIIVSMGGGSCCNMSCMPSSSFMFLCVHVLLMMLCFATLCYETVGEQSPRHEDCADRMRSSAHRGPYSVSAYSSSSTWLHSEVLLPHSLVTQYAVYPRVLRYSDIVAWWVTLMMLSCCYTGLNGILLYY